jgi:protein-S-isoprenylcysteine O-methyltransferase Ste14
MEFNMTYFTEIQFGIWNAWIGSVILLLAGTNVMFINKKATKRLMDMSWYTRREKIAATLSMLAMYGVVIFSIWIPLKVGTMWFYSGLALWLIGIIGGLIALKNYATTPSNEPVTKGLYKISRNPLYFFYALGSLGICVASASLPLFIAWVIYNIPTHIMVLGEERYCLKTYGKDYENFIRKIPRYFLFF